VSQGASNKEMAQRLNLTERTIKAHLTGIFKKLEISSRVQLARFVVGGRPPAEDITRSA
jgi:two-component system nitrate/nitrite response regulator NarL